MENGLNKIRMKHKNLKETFRKNFGTCRSTRVSMERMFDAFREAMLLDLKEESGFKTPITMIWEKNFKEYWNTKVWMWNDDVTKAELIFITGLSVNNDRIYSGQAEFRFASLQNPNE